MVKFDETLQMFKDLTDAPGVPGHEREARKVMTKYIKPYADQVEMDNLGSLIARKKGQANGPKIMVAGHLDEVGFMVTQITENGFLRFQPLGGWWEQVMLAGRVHVFTRDGEAIDGVIGSKPPHILTAEERKKPVDKKDMFVDIGAMDKEEAEAFGIRPGDVIVPASPFTVMKNSKLLMAKAWDNRIGCALAIEVLKQLQDKTHPNTVFGVGTVQEEVGLRGAGTSAHHIQPDLSFAVDVGIAGDTPGLKAEEGRAKIGDGPQVLIYDGSMIAHKGLKDFVVEIAEREDIPFQYDLMAGGGQDGGKIHLTGSGVPTLAITIPTRYIHSHAAILHRDDFENAARLLVSVIEKLDEDTVKELKLK